MDEPRKDAPKWNRLRRTPLRRQGELKRSGRLRQRSKTNSKPWVNDELRAEYRAANESCQCCALIFGHQSKRVHDTEHIHHLWAGHPRWDLWANLVGVCERCHRWLHEHPADGKWVALYAKIKAAESDPRHWNLEELNTAARQRVEGWVLRPDKQPQLEWVREWYRDDVLRVIQMEKVFEGTLEVCQEFVRADRFSVLVYDFEIRGVDPNCEVWARRTTPAGG